MQDFGYGLWALVIIDTAVVLIFAASFFHPKSKRDWRVFGGFSAFMVALFTEMYGLPLTVYLLSGWLGSGVLGLDLTHDGGHLWSRIFGWGGDPHFSPFHIASYVVILAGFWVISAGWSRLYAAASADRLATDGPYARVRHPQYAGFLMIMIGFLLQWPTLPTLIMFPVLVVVYRRLSMSEERETHVRFGESWDEYAARTPRFIPRLYRPGSSDRATIIVNNGYHPDIVRARAGTPLHLRFDRRESNPCSDSVVFAKLGTSAQLPEGLPVSVDLPPLEIGTYEFACPNGLVRGELIVS